MPETLTALVWLGAVATLAVAATLVGVIYSNMDKRVEALAEADAIKHDRIAHLETRVPVLETRILAVETKIVEKLDQIIWTQQHDKQHDRGN